MPDNDVVPDLKQILGAMIFGANHPLSVRQMLKCLVEVSEIEGEETVAFADVKESDIQAALKELVEEFEKLRCGSVLTQVAGGFRFQSDVACGKWLRHLLKAGKRNRLSQPGLETLAIIAHRQPIARSEIESVRGVNVDHMIRALMEMQLVRIVGRSSLPGRPFLYGTTQAFLEHFGLNDLGELNDMESMSVTADGTDRGS